MLVETMTRQPTLTPPRIPSSQTARRVFRFSRFRVFMAQAPPLPLPQFSRRAPSFHEPQTPNRYVTELIFTDVINVSLDDVTSTGRDAKGATRYAMLTPCRRCAFTSPRRRCAFAAFSSDSRLISDISSLSEILLSFSSFSFHFLR